MPIRFASEAWPRPGLAWPRLASPRPRRASIAGLHQHNRKGKIVMIKTKNVAMSQRNQHLTHAMLRKPATTTPKQFQTTWCFGKDWQHAGEARDLQSATVFPGILPVRTEPQATSATPEGKKKCSPESCHSVALAIVLLFVKAAPFFAKKVTSAISFSGP